MKHLALLALLSAGLWTIALPAAADREPVLSQIAVPHDYYYREMYLPQLTSGPSSLAWLPSGDALVFSMQGSLWLQRLDSTRARQLTNGPGYDYQPDVASDGTRVVFARYDGRAINLQVLDLETGDLRALTEGNNVNVEPRWSPDGQRLAWVSTRLNNRFHVFVGSLTRRGLESAPMLPERVSRTPRYYYSEYDHELSPAWSPDGKNLLYVSNPETIYGSGGIWRRATGGGKAIPLRIEETTWRARPDWSPDGKRVIYSSYLGRQWHQLWLTTAAGGGDPLPLSYGDYDITGARWSPDGESIAYVANEHGGLEIRVQTVVGGKVEPLQTLERDYLEPQGELALSIVDAQGEAVSARVMVTASDGRRYAPAGALMRADDGFDREHAQYEPQYFHARGNVRLSLPAGSAEVTAWRGPEHALFRQAVTVTAEGSTGLDVVPTRLDMPDAWRGQVSGDVHVHMNYGGHYRNTPQQLRRQAEAEDLDIVFNLVVNKEQRIPDIRAFTTEPDNVSTRTTTLLHAQEFHTSYWGHLGLLGLDDHFLLPDYSTYANTGLASPYPDNSTVGRLAHEQNALVGYVHPFLSVPDPSTETISNALPVDAALGTADYYEVVGFADHRASAEVWYRLLNCGIRLAAAGGTDAMANYASMRGPVGINRTYVDLPQPATSPAERTSAWLDGLRAGRSIATNTPLLGFYVEGSGPGEEIDLPAGSHEVSYRGFLRSMVGIDHLEIVLNGEVVERIDTRDGGKRADFEGRATVDSDGYLLLRAWNEQSSPEVFDLYPYATTNPVFIDVAGSDVACGADADYFIAWIDRVRAGAAEHPDYNNERERQAVLDNIDAARAVFEARR